MTKQFIKENWTLILTIFYIIWPIDLIPEFLAPILGPFIFSDDLIIVLLEVYRRYKNNKKTSQSKTTSRGDVIDGEIVE